jgi:hypothetical protein
LSRPNARPGATPVVDHLRRWMTSASVIGRKISTDANLVLSKPQSDPDRHRLAFTTAFH